jgi:hypothetical protein
MFPPPPNMASSSIHDVLWGHFKFNPQQPGYNRKLLFMEETLNMNEVRQSAVPILR